MSKLGFVTETTCKLLSNNISEKECDLRFHVYDIYVFMPYQINIYADQKKP